jgi:hypothetical protein
MAAGASTAPLKGCSAGEMFRYGAFSINVAKWSWPICKRKEFTEL